MSNWYSKIESDISLISDFIDYYNKELIESKKELRTHGRIEKISAELPSVLEHRYNQLQDIEAILEFLNIELKRLRFKYYKSYLTTYNGARALTDRQLEKFSLGEPEVLDMEALINSVAFLRNQYLGIMKGLEAKSFTLSNVTRLRCAGLDDASIN